MEPRGLRPHGAIIRTFFGRSFPPSSVHAFVAVFIEIRRSKNRKKSVVLGLQRTYESRSFSSWKLVFPAKTPFLSYPSSRSKRYRQPRTPLRVSRSHVDVLPNFKRLPWSKSILVRFAKPIHLRLKENKTVLTISGVCLYAQNRRQNICSSRIRRFRRIHDRIARKGQSQVVLRKKLFGTLKSGKRYLTNADSSLLWKLELKYFSTCENLTVIVDLPFMLKAHSISRI